MEAEKAMEQRIAGKKKARLANGSVTRTVGFDDEHGEQNGK